MKGRILLAILILGIVGAIATYMWNKPHRNIATSKEDFTLTADSFYKEYAANEEASNAKYLDKVIEVKGDVGEIELENEDEPTVALQTSSLESTVRCGFKKEMLVEIKKLKKGDQIKIKGKCDGLGMFGLVLTQCVLIK